MKKLRGKKIPKPSTTQPKLSPEQINIIEKKSKRGGLKKKDEQREPTGNLP